MRVFRIERQKHLKTTLTGAGAALMSGFRWNSLNTRLVYTAESRALATLEVAVHLDISEDLPNDRYLIEIDIPNSVKIIELPLSKLPKGWDAKPPNEHSQEIGDAFVVNMKAAVLKVPSSIIHQEFNYLINPLHPEAKKIKIISKKKFSFDKRIRS